MTKKDFIWLCNEHTIDPLFDESHMMVSNFTDEDVNVIIDAVESPNDPIETLVDAAEKYKETLIKLIKKKEK